MAQVYSMNKGGWNGTEEMEWKLLVHPLEKVS